MLIAPRLQLYPIYSSSHQFVAHLYAYCSLDYGPLYPIWSGVYRVAIMSLLHPCTVSGISQLCALCIRSLFPYSRALFWLFSFDDDRALAYLACQVVLLVCYALD